MTNNEKRAAELAEEIIRTDIMDDITPAILESLNAAQAEGYKQGVLHANEDTYDSGYVHGYKQGAEKMREDAANSCDNHRHGYIRADNINAASACIENGRRIRALPITPPQPAAQAEDDYTTCPECGGDADNGWSREVPPSAYLCSKCESSVDDDSEMLAAFEAAMQSLDNVAKNLAIGCQQSVSNDIWNAMEQAKAAWKEKSK